MTPVEGRTRAAMDAITGLVESVPPLRLPPLPDAAPRSWRPRGVPRPRRRWGSWLAPVAAAAAVLAVALTLVTVRNMPGGQTAPAGGPAISLAGPPVSFPDYYLTFNQPRGHATIPVGLVLRETLTGKKLATLQPPRGLSFAGITAAADDRTFVADAHLDPYGVGGSEGRSRAWYLVRVTGSASQVSLKMTKLAIPPTPVGTNITGIALSPDASMLAVGSMPNTDIHNVSESLRVYSVATGAVLHSWSTAPGQLAIEGGGGDGGDANATLAWVGERALAYNGGRRLKSGPVTLAVMEIGLSRPDGNLVASSRTAAVLPPENSDTRSPYGCAWFWGDVMVTGDGKSYVCGGEGTSGAKLPTLACGKGPAWNTVAFTGFSLTTGKLTGFLSGYKMACYGYAVQNPYPVWVNATGSTVIGYMYLGNSRQLFGVFSHGSFRPLPIPVPGNWYQYMAGSLLNQVAW